MSEQAEGRLMGYLLHRVFGGDTLVSAEMEPDPEGGWYPSEEVHKFVAYLEAEVARLREQLEAARADALLDVWEELQSAECQMSTLDGRLAFYDWLRNERRALLKEAPRE